MILVIIISKSYFQDSKKCLKIEIKFKKMSKNREMSKNRVSENRDPPVVPFDCTLILNIGFFIAKQSAEQGNFTKRNSGKLGNS